MRLLKPNPGECVDRQTILLLKLTYGSKGVEPKITEEGGEVTGGAVFRKVVAGASNVNLQPFVDEANQIQDYLNDHYGVDSMPEAKGVKYQQLYDELADVNDQVWLLTDTAHVLTDAPDRMVAQVTVRAAEVLFQITALNDKRARIVGQINELFSVKHIEKIYA